MMTALLVLIPLAITVVAIQIMRVLARVWKLKRENFLGKQIPTGFGFVLVFVTVATYTTLFKARQETTVFLAAVVGFGILGLIDDMYGSREAGGFRGHLGLLLRGKISTGLVKAIGGGILAVVLGAVLADLDPATSLLNGFLIALTANLLNLLDLRPGRAVSCFWACLLVLAVAKSSRLPIWRELIPVLVPAAWLTMLDRSAKVMLGDAGSNVLGAVLGLALVYGIGPPARLAVVLFLIAVHVYSEKYSISKLIEGNRLLRSMDRLLGER